MLVLPYRHPLAAAKALATIDVLSGGRTVVGVGARWLRKEFEALGVAISERGSRTDETIDIFKAAWTQDVINFSGRHFQIKEIKCLPRPVQTPRPPVLIGGMTQSALRRVARRGDGWIAMGSSPRDLQGPLNTLRRLTEESHRSPKDLQICVLPLASPRLDQLLRDLPRYEELGVNHVYISFPAWTDNFSELMKPMGRFSHETGTSNK